MQLNPDCVRDILLKLEKLPLGGRSSIKILKESLNYTEDEITYHCLKLVEAKYIKVIDKFIDSNNMPHIDFITDITFKGHEFLANIRNDTFFNKVKAVGKELGLSSLKDLAQIATASAALVIKAHFNLL